VSITEFGNQGGGIYDIRIVPFIDNPACAWLSGEYVYTPSNLSSHAPSVVKPSCSRVGLGTDRRP
jgi:hypothetical protein